MKQVTEYWICVFVPFFLVTFMAYTNLEVALGMIAALIGCTLFALYKRKDAIAVEDEQ